MKLLDTVAILKDFEDEGLVRGQVGTIVETLSQGYFEVEFCNSGGETYAMAALHESDLIHLHYNKVAA